MQADGRRQASAGYIATQVLLAAFLLSLLTTDASRYATGAAGEAETERAEAVRDSGSWVIEDATDEFVAEQELSLGGYEEPDQLAFGDNEVPASTSVVPDQEAAVVASTSSTSSSTSLSSASQTPPTEVVPSTTAVPTTQASSTESTAPTSEPQSTSPAPTIEAAGTGAARQTPTSKLADPGYAPTTQVEPATTPTSEVPKATGRVPKPTTSTPATTTTPPATTTSTIQATTTSPQTTAPVTEPPTTEPPTTLAPTTQAPTTPAPTTVAPTTTLRPVTASAFDSIRNSDSKFRQFSSLRSNELRLDALTIPAPREDNGSVGDGQFRVACQYSHFSYDDPIVYPGEPGKSHLHMFFGNTETDAYSTTDSLVNSGGATCNGFELNRSAYWTPALLDGTGNVVVPDNIVLYYKTKHPSVVQRMPQGLRMLAGNSENDSFTADHYLAWTCGESGFSYNMSNRIQACGADPLNASIVFPQCWDGTNLDSADHRSHMRLVAPERPCPSSHPVRLPQISILLYFPGANSVNGWHLSSDRSDSFNSGPGSTLHADWWGAWNDEAMDLWTTGCMKRARNCSFGQTGTPRQLTKISNLQDYTGPNFLPLP